MSFYNKDMTCALNKAVLYVNNKTKRIEPINNEKICPLLDLILNGDTTEIYSCNHVGQCYMWFKNKQEHDAKAART